MPTTRGSYPLTPWSTTRARELGQGIHRYGRRCMTSRRLHPQPNRCRPKCARSRLQIPEGTQTTRMGVTLHAEWPSEGRAHYPRFGAAMHWDKALAVIAMSSRSWAMYLAMTLPLLALLAGSPLGSHTLRASGFNVS